MLFDNYIKNTYRGIIKLCIYSSEKVLSYVYKCIHKTTGKIYIGSRTANKIPSHIDFPEYRTSSKYIKPDFENFDWFIIAEFFNPIDAYNLEQQLIFEQWKISRENSLNRKCHYNGGIFNPIGQKRTEETKQLLSKVHTGEKHSQERNKKKSKNGTILHDFLLPDGIVLYDISMKEFCSYYNLVGPTAMKNFGKHGKFKQFYYLGKSDSNPEWLLQARAKSGKSLKLRQKQNPSDEKIKEKISKTLTKNYYDFLTPDGFVIENLSMKDLCKQFNLDYHRLAKNFARDKSHKGFIRLWIHQSSS